MTSEYSDEDTEDEEHIDNGFRWVNIVNSTKTKAEMLFMPASQHQIELHHCVFGSGRSRTPNMTDIAKCTKDQQSHHKKERWKLTQNICRVQDVVLVPILRRMGSTSIVVNYFFARTATVDSQVK